jgi:polyphosphate glucokinase
MTILGIDIGGTGIKGALVNVETGELVAERFRILTPQPSHPDALAAAVEQVAAHFKHRGLTGITFPGIVKNGVVTFATNMAPEWSGADASAIFTKRLKHPVRVVNDADAAGYAEMRFGAGRDKKGVVLMLTFGTGVGSALFCNGVLIPNTEFGNLKIRGKTAEHRASERAREEGDLSFKQWSKRVGEYLADLEPLLSPELFIIGGGISKKADKFLPRLTAMSKVPIEAAILQNNAGIIGAACLAKNPS